MNVQGINWNVEFVTSLSFDQFKVEFAEQHFTDLDAKKQEKRLKEVYEYIHKETGKEAVVSSNKPTTRQSEGGE